MLGLKHNASSHLVMYFLNVDGSEVLDREDILALSACHKLRMAVVPTFLPIGAGSSSSVERGPGAPVHVEGRMSAGEP